ncbi:MAG: OsmC family protein [Ignavibacteriales bacterium]|nr:OsmC family protein [Ignavibacteriales bacterium]
MELVITLPEGKKVDANYNGYIIHTDQPIQVGGDGTAPAPFDLFLASIGTCAGIYVKGFCTSRGIPTKDIKIIQNMNFNPVTRLVDNIHLDIQLPEDFPEKFKDAVINAAELCAVKKHLQTPPKFSIQTSVLNSVL